MASSSIYHDFKFILSSDLNLDVKVYISSLHLDLDVVARLQDALGPASSSAFAPDALYVTAQLTSGGIPLHSVTKSTQLPEVGDNTVHWDEWLTLPVKIRDLPPTAQLVITVWGVGPTVLCGTTLRLFDRKLRLKRGLQKLLLWPQGATIPEAAASWVVSPEDAEYYRLLKLKEKYDHREIPRVPWLDRLAFRQMESLRLGLTVPSSVATASSSFVDMVGTQDGGSGVAQASSTAATDGGSTPSQRPQQSTPTAATPGVRSQAQAGSLFTGLSHHQGIRADPWELYVEFPYFEFPVIFEEPTYDHPDAHLAPRLPLITPSTPYAKSEWSRSLRIVTDPETGTYNPAETKYHKLARGIFRGFIDRDLKPNKEDLRRIQEAVKSGYTLDIINAKLGTEQTELLWKFRYSLTSNPKALTPFVMCVDWNDEAEAKEATELLHHWAPIEVEDALHLLSPKFEHFAVREFAVTTLDKATNEELTCYLLQLVQALRYDPMLAHLTDESVASPSAGGQSVPRDSTAGAGTTPAAGAGAPVEPSSSREDHGRAGNPAHDGSKPYKLSPLADFLVDRAVKSVEVANFLNWYLAVETEDVRHGKMFGKVHHLLMNTLRSDPALDSICAAIAEQGVIVAQLFAARDNATDIKRGSKSIAAKIQKLNDMFTPDGACADLVSFRQPIMLPLDPRISITGVVPGKCTMFRSKQYPMVVSFTVDPALSGSDWQQAGAGAAPAETSAVEGSGGSTTPTPRTFKVIFKSGDDMRQDQLVMQLIRLMDLQLKRVNLDLKLSPYKVLATSTRTGIMEMVVNSKPVSQVLKENNSNILTFFRNAHPCAEAEYGIDPEVMDTYVKSCAGYCVITFLLGIGDRHLDNVMLQSDGHLFHIDFGYIFGNDPKPFPPPMKLTKEMVEGMGGPESEHYRRFLGFCCQAYNILRKSAPLFLNLLNLMRGAGLDDLSADPDTTLMKLRDNFRLEIDDEKADYFFMELVEQSVTAFFPVLAEIIHKVAVSMR